jgi:hypothetical protein
MSPHAYNHFFDPKTLHIPPKVISIRARHPKVKISKVISIRDCIPQSQNIKSHFNTWFHPKNSKYQNSFQYVLSSPKLKMQELKTTSKLTPKKHPTTRNPNPHFEARFEFVTTFIKNKDYTKSNLQKIKFTKNFSLSQSLMSKVSTHTKV